MYIFFWFLYYFKRSVRYNSLCINVIFVYIFKIECILNKWSEKMFVIKGW